MVLVQSIMDQTNSRLAPQLGQGLRTKTPEIQPAPDGLPILLRNGHGLSVKSKWIKLAPGRLLDRFLGSRVPDVPTGHKILSLRLRSLCHSKPRRGPVPRAGPRCGKLPRDPPWRRKARSGARGPAGAQNIDKSLQNLPKIWISAAAVHSGLRRGVT